jgi:hypothetical protein
MNKNERRQKLKRSALQRIFPFVGFEGDLLETDDAGNFLFYGGNRHGPDRVAWQILAAWRIRSLTVLAVWSSENRSLASFDNFFFDFNLLL